MKKKFLLLFSTLTMSVASVSALVFAKTNDNDFIKNVRGGEDSTFSLAQDEGIQLDDNTYQLKLRSPKASIRLDIVGGDATSLANGRIEGSETNPGLYFYNDEADPIRGISDFNFAITGTCAAAVYFSYNPITLDEVYSQKYQDLMCFYSFMSDEVAICKNEYSEILNARYFFVSLEAIMGTIEIPTLSVTTECSAEPDIVEIGTNEGELSEAQQEYISTSVNGSANAPASIGNGTFAFSDHILNNMDEFFYAETFQDEPSLFMSFMMNDDFEMTSDESMTDNFYTILLQKQAGESTSTIICAYIMGRYSQFMFMLFDSEFPYQGETDSNTWPQDKINECISLKYSSLVIPFEDENIASYSIMSGEMMPYGIAIGINFKVTPSDFEIQEMFDSYLDLYEDNGFRYATGDPCVYYDNGRFSITYTYIRNFSRFYLIFTESKLYTLPSATELVSKLHLPNEDAIVRFNNEQEFERLDYTSSGTTYTFSCRRYKEYTREEMNTFLNRCVDEGYTITDVQSNMNNYYYYYNKCEKVTDRYGSYLEININKGGSLTYTHNLADKSDAEFADFESMFNAYAGSNITSTNFETIVNSVNLTKASGYHIYGNNSVAFIEGAGQEFIDSFDALANTSFVSTINMFLIDRFTGIRVEQIDGGVLLSKKSASPYNSTVSYTSFNDKFKDLDESIRIVLYDTDGFENNFVGSMYYGYPRYTQKLRNVITERLEDLGFTYSKYDDAFYKACPEEGEGSYHKYHIWQHNGGLSFYYDGVVTEKNSFISYNELSSESKQFLSHYPSFVSDNNEDILYVDGEASNSVDLTIDFTDSDVNSYIETLLSEGFIEGHANNYLKVMSDGKVYEVRIQESERFMTLRFYQGATDYETYDEAFSGQSEAKAIADELNFDTYFSSERAIYKLYADDEYFRLSVFDNRAGVKALRNSLKSLGFKSFSALGTKYMVYTNPSNTCSYMVGFFEDEIDQAITVHKVEKNYYSLDTVLASASTFDYDSIKEYLPLPSSEDNIFSLVSYKEGYLKIIANYNFDYSAYRNLLAGSANSYGTSNQVFIAQFDKGVVMIDPLGNGGYEITIIDSTVEGNSLQNPLTANLGNNYFQINEDRTYFAFTAECDGVYTFETNSSLDTVGYLYFEQYSSENRYDMYNYAKEPGVNNNFSITVHLNEGQTVYIGTDLSHSEQKTFQNCNLVVSCVPD